MSTAVYPPRGTSPWDHPLRQYIDKSVDEVRNAVRSILGSMEGLTNPGALAEWHAVDPALETKRIAFIGDSITEGCLASSYTKTYPMLLQSALRTKYGINGGLGYVNAASTTNGVVPLLPVTRSGGVNEDINGGWYRGLGSHAVQVGHATTDHLTYTQPCTSVEIRYGTAWLGGQLRILIDGVEVALLSSNAPSVAEEQSGLSWTSAQLTPGNHTVRIEGANAPNFPAVFEGITFFNGDESSGVRVYNAGHYGAQAPEFASGTLAMQALNRTNPHLVVVYLGTNDLIGGTVSGFLTAIDAITSNIRPEASILLIGGYLRGDEAEKPTQVAKWQQMKAGLVDRAVGRIAYLDLQPHWDALTPSGSLSPLMADRIHPNDAGFQRITDVLFAALQPDLLAGIIGYSGGSGSVDVSGKLDKTETLTTAPTAPLFKRVLNYVLSTSQPNLFEFNINGVVRSWLNEWGALRGRVPYNNYNDALVRAIIEPGDTIQTSGNAFEVVDRRKPAGDGRQSWGVRWSDGREVRNGHLMVPVYLHENPTDPLPADLPIPCIIFEEDV